MAPAVRAIGAAPPPALRPAYRSFAEDTAMQAAADRGGACGRRFHFGLPPAPVIAALKARGCLLLASATSLAEALAI
jgi:nitronate monooxygenase